MQGGGGWRHAEGSWRGMSGPFHLRVEGLFLYMSGLFIYGVDVSQLIMMVCLIMRCFAALLCWQGAVLIVILCAIATNNRALS